MPIVDKAAALQSVAKLTERLDALKKTLEGVEPNSNLWNLYSQNPSDFNRDFVEIAEQDLAYAIGDLEVILKELKKSKTLKAHKLKTPVKIS